MTAPRCQIPPPPHCSSSNALDSAVRKPGETPVLWPVPGQLADHSMGSQIKPFLSSSMRKLWIYGTEKQKKDINVVLWNKKLKKKGKNCRVDVLMSYDGLQVDALMDSTGSYCFFPLENKLLLIISWSLLRLPWQKSCWVDCPCVEVFLSVWAEPRVTLSNEVLIKWNLNTLGAGQVGGFCIVRWEQGPRRLRKALNMQRSFGISKCLLIALI